MWYTISSYKGVIDMSNDVVNEMNNTLIKQINEIKKDIISTRNRVLLDANKELLYLYFRIGKIISENQKYGTNFINTLSTSLKLEFNDASGFSPRNLARMRKFYETYKDIENLPMPLAKLPWSFNCLLIDKIKSLDIRIWYAEKCVENGWSHIVLDHQIDLNLYERQANNNKKLTNFKNELSEVQGELALDVIKDPYIFELAGLSEKSKEADIEKAMIEICILLFRNLLEKDFHLLEINIELVRKIKTTLLIYCFII